jgi:hypothetical protein
MAWAASNDRAGLIAAICTVNYLAFGLPALIAGIATSHFGLHDTALVYSVVIALLAVAAAGGFLFESNVRSRAPRAVAPPPEMPPGPPCTQAAPRKPGRCFLCRALVFAPGFSAVPASAGTALTGLSRFPGDRLPAVTTDVLT